MSQQHCHFDASRSLTALEQDSTIIAVIEMSQSKWLVAQRGTTLGLYRTGSRALGWMQIVSARIHCDAVKQS